MVWLGWLVEPPALVIATAGAVVSSVMASAAVVELLPKAVAELRRDRLAAVGPEVAGRHRQADAAGRHLGRRDGVRHRMRQRLPLPSTAAPYRRPPPSAPSATVKLGAVTSVRLSVLELPLSEPATRSGVPPVGAVVFSV